MKINLFFASLLLVVGENQERGHVLPFKMASKTKDSDKGSTGKKEAKKRQRTEVEDDSSSSSSASESEQSDVSEDEGDLEHEV